LHLWYEKIREDHLSSWNFQVSFGVVSGHGDGPWAMACHGGSMSEVDNLVERKLHRIYVYLASWSANGKKWRQELQNHGNIMGVTGVTMQNSWGSHFFTSWEMCDEW
jgi:hypothetical protein